VCIPRRGCRCHVSRILATFIPLPRGVAGVSRWICSHVTELVTVVIELLLHHFINGELPFRHVRVSRSFISRAPASMEAQDWGDDCVGGVEVPTRSSGSATGVGIRTPPGV